MHLSHTVGPEHADRAIEIVTEFINITMKGDVGFMYDGMQPKQRKMAEDPITLIMQLVRKNAGTEGVDQNEILDLLEEELGISRAKGEKYIEQMHLQGRIAEVRTGRWMKG